jgi:hypothetical protein
MRSLLAEAHFEIGRLRYAAGGLPDGNEAVDGDIGIQQPELKATTFRSTPEAPYVVLLVDGDAYDVSLKSSLARQSTNLRSGHRAYSDKEVKITDQASSQVCLPTSVPGRTLTGDSK